MRHETGHDRSCSAGGKSQPPGYRFLTRDYEYLQVICVRRGALHLRAGLRTRILGPGDVLLLRVGGEFELRCLKVGYSGVFFLARPGDPLAAEGEALAFRGTGAAAWLARVMEQELARPGPESRELLLALGRALAITALRRARESAAPPSPQARAAYWAESARQALEASLHTGKGAREILSPLPLSYRQLARHFRAEFDLSPKQYLVRARAREAARLLADTNLPVTAVAYELHFSSSQHFAASFARATGLSPSAWRRRERKRATETGDTRPSRRG